MPELPEVETVRIGLARLIIGKKITDVSFDWPKGFQNSQSDVDAFIIGAEVVDVRRRAKVLMIELSTNYTLVIHLKMTGQLVFVGSKMIEDRGARIEVGKRRSPISDLRSTESERFGAGHPNESLIGELPDKSTRVIFRLVDADKEAGLEASTRKARGAERSVYEVRDTSTGEPDKVIAQDRWQSFGLGPKAGQRGQFLYFNDQRKFGWIKLLPKNEVQHMPFMQKVGPEPLEESFTYEVFQQRLIRRNKSNIKSVLLDQTILAGIGNIYADEALWGAKIHPSTTVETLLAEKPSRLKKLHREIIFVLKLSIEKGGSTDRNYVNAEGKRGNYIDFARVFRKENQPCPRCVTTIIKTRVAGRGTHTCPTCQLATNSSP